MINRHPQVFDNEEAVDADESLRRWEARKVVEKGRSTLSSRLRAVPAMLPALMRAQKIAKKAGLTAGAAEAVDSLSAALPALSAGDPAAIGQALLSLCRLAELSGVSAEECLTRTVEDVISDAEKAENSVNN